MARVSLYPPNSVVMAPLSGYTDLPYRRSMRRWGCSFAFTEMVDVASLAHARERSQHMLNRGDDEDFLGVQLVGSDVEFIKIAVDVINEYDFDVLDFNLGCPVPKVAKKGAGAALGRDVERALACFSIFKERSRHKLSAKIRILNDYDPTPSIELVQGLYELGAQAVTVHGRVKEKFYSGPVFFEQIKAIRDAVPVQIVANGGIMDIASAREIREATSCDAIMVARGAMGNPWLFSEIAQGDSFSPPTLDTMLKEVATHIMELVNYYGEDVAMRMARKMIHDYFRGRGFAGEFRSGASFLNTYADLEKFLAEAPAAHADSYWRQVESGVLKERCLGR